MKAESVKTATPAAFVEYHVENEDKNNNTKSSVISAGKIDHVFRPPPPLRPRLFYYCCIRRATEHEDLSITPHTCDVTCASRKETNLCMHAACDNERQALEYEEKKCPMYNLAPRPPPCRRPKTSSSS